MKNRNIKIEIISLILIFMISLVAFNSCMETTKPEETELKELIVKAILVDNNGNLSKSPLRGVDVVLNPAGEINNAEPISNATTDENGLAKFSIELPITGQNIDISAEFNGEVQSKSGILFCRDTLVLFVFDFETTAPIECDNINTASEIIFINDDGNPILKQNTPKEVNKYFRCETLTNSLNNSQDLIVDIPNPMDPFKLESVSINNRFISERVGLVLKPGESLNICYSVSTLNQGTFESITPIGIRCGNNSKIHELTLRAEVVEPTCECNLLEYENLVTVTERVPTNESRKEKVVLFNNDLNCEVTATLVEGFDNPDWQLINPQFPKKIAVGKDFEIEFSFKPSRVGMSTARITLNIQTSTGDNCELEIDFEGEACSDACPSFGMNIFEMETFNTNRATDTLSNRSDNRVFISVTDIDPPLITEVSGIYYVENPDSACSDVTLSLSIVPNDNFSSRYFTVSPRTLTLSPGERSSFEVFFTSPNVAELEAIVQSRGNTGKASDSTFGIKVMITSQGCRKELEVTAIVTSIPDISPIINLRAYFQSTPNKPDPEYEVYFFGDDSRTINQGREYPPLFGDIFIDLLDNSINSHKPQPPILVAQNQSIGIKFWKAMNERDFSNVLKTMEEFANDPNYDTGYSSLPLSPLQVQGVYAIEFSNGIYALIYIRRIDDGEENTSSKQSGIEFRAIYPIIIR